MNQDVIIIYYGAEDVLLCQERRLPGPEAFGLYFIPDNYGCADPCTLVQEHHVYRCQSHFRIFFGFKDKFRNLNHLKLYSCCTCLYIGFLSFLLSQTRADWSHQAELIMVVWIFHQSDWIGTLAGIGFRIFGQLEKWCSHSRDLLMAGTCRTLRVLGLNWARCSPVFRMDFVKFMMSYMIKSITYMLIDLLLCTKNFRYFAVRSLGKKG